MKLSQLPQHIRLKTHDRTGKSGYHHKCGMYIYTLDEWASHTCHYKKKNNPKTKREGKIIL